MSIDRLAHRLASQRASDPGSQLEFSSIEDGAIEEYYNGQHVSSIGLQFDGTHVAASLSGPKPPTPNRPIVTPGLESLTVRIDGVFLGEDGQPDITVIPNMDFSRFEVHVSRDPEFEAAMATTLKGTVETPRGGEVVISPLAGGETYYVRVVTRSLSGKFSDDSAVASGVPSKPSDIVLTKIDAAQTVIDNVGLALVHAEDGQEKTLDTAINDAAASPVTDARLSEGSLTVWPFQGETVPAGALEPGAVGDSDIADFAIVAKKFNTNRHMIY